MSFRRLFLYAAILLLFANGASAARYQRTNDGKTMVWNTLRGVAQDVTWSGLRDLNGYATGEGTLTWYRLGSVVNTYTGKMVKGKFEGTVIRVQGSTKLQATFANGEIASGWLEPGEPSNRSPTPLPNEQSPAPAETKAKPVKEVATPSPIPTAKPTPLGTTAIEPTVIPTPKPTRTPTPTPTATPAPTPTPISTSIVELSPKQTPTPKSTPVGMPILLPTPRSTSTPAASTIQQLSPTGSPSGPVVEAPVHSLELAIPASPTPQLMPESALRKESSSQVPRVSPSSSAPTSPRKIDPNLKRQMIADLRRQTDFVLGQVRDATGNFHEIDRLDQVKILPPAVSAHVTLLANQALQFRATLGYEVAYYECLAEIQAVDALVVVDEATRNLAAKDSPSARTTLWNFTKRYSEPAAATQKPLWRYLVSLFSLCDRLKNEAEGHLPRALSLETSGKKSEALQELREIYRIYPNPLTADKIKQLQAQLH